MLFIVKSVTSVDLSLVRLHLKIHLRIRDSVKCIVSSEEPGDCDGDLGIALDLISHSVSKRGGLTVIKVCVCRQWGVGGGRVKNNGR